MTAYYGISGDLVSLPTPAAEVNIASSTNATPIVVTTSGAHGLQTGQAVIINGHLVNTTANGQRLVTVLSSTTFQVKTFAGASVAGVGVGVATGTVQSLALPGIDLPQDAVTNIDAASVNVPFEALADMTAWAAYKLLANVVILKGGTLGALVGSTTVIAGSAMLSGAVTLSGDVEVTAAGTLALNGLVTHRAPNRTTDANQLLNTTNGVTTLLAPTTAGTTRTIRLQTTTAPVPLEGEQMLIVGADSEGGTPGSYNYSIQREDTVEMAKIYGIGAWVLCQFEGGVWRGIKHSGVNSVTPANGHVLVSAGW